MLSCSLDFFSLISEDDYLFKWLSQSLLQAVYPHYFFIMLCCIVILFISLFLTICTNALSVVYM